MKNENIFLVGVLKLLSLVVEGDRATRGMYPNSHATPIYHIRNTLGPKNIYEVLFNPLDNLWNFILRQEGFVSNRVLDSSEGECNSSIVSTNPESIAATINCDSNWPEKLTATLRAVAG